MRILWLKSDLLLPLDKGGKLRTWHLMRHLARRHEITYLAFAEQGTPAADVDGMRQVAARVETVERSEPAKGTLRFYLDAARHLADPVPPLRLVDGRSEVETMELGVRPDVFSDAAEVTVGSSNIEPLPWLK